MSSGGVIVVHGMTLSTATQRVMAVLAEKDLEFQLNVVNLMNGENLSEDYLEKQPFGTIPTLVDVDGFTIYESRAICRYLDTKYKGKGPELVPKNIKALGLFEQGVSIEATSFDPLATQIVGEKVFKKMRGAEPDMNKVKQLREQLGEILDVYDQILANQQYIGGNQYTLADLFHLPYGAMLVKAGEGDLFESRSNVKQWWNRIYNRKAWQKVMSMK